MDKEKEAKGLLEGILAKLSTIGNPKQEKEDVVAEVELSETEVEEVATAPQEEVQEVSEPVETELSAEEPKYVTIEDFDKFKTELTAIFKSELEKKEQEKVELSEQVVELQSQPASEPITHSPEMEDKEVKGFRYASRKPRGMMDNILESISKYK